MKYMTAWKWWLWFSMGIWVVALPINLLKGNWFDALTEVCLIILGGLMLENLDHRCVDCHRGHAEVMAQFSKDRREE